MVWVEIKDGDLLAGLIGGVAAGLVVIMADDLTKLFYGDQMSVLSIIFKVVCSFVLLLVVIIVFLLKRKSKKKKKKIF